MTQYPLSLERIKNRAVEYRSWRRLGMGVGLRPAVPRDELDTIYIGAGERSG